MTNQENQTPQPMENNTEEKAPLLFSSREGVLPIEEMPFEETLEAILFAAGHAVPYERLADTFHISPSEMKKRVSDYAKNYNAPDENHPRGVILLTLDDACQLCTKEVYLPYIREALGIRRSGTLSTSSIETLAIIAYNQPVTRAYIDTVRAVDSSYAVSNLLERGLIECRGRVEAPGRPMLYGTTNDFLRCFGLNSLSELPGISSEEATDLLERMQQNLNPDFDKNQMTMDVEEDIPTEENNQ